MLIESADVQFTDAAKARIEGWGMDEPTVVAWFQKELLMDMEVEHVEEFFYHSVWREEDIDHALCIYPRKDEAGVIVGMEIDVADDVDPGEGDKEQEQQIIRALRGPAPEEVKQMMEMVKAAMIQAGRIVVQPDGTLKPAEDIEEGKLEGIMIGFDDDGNMKVKLFDPEEAGLKSKGKEPH